MLAQAEEIQKVVDHIASQSDRWWFTGSQVILLIFCAAIIRYLIKDREAARVEHAAQLKAAYEQADRARQEHAETMKSMYGEMTAMNAKLLVSLQENNALLERLEKVLDRMGPNK